MPERSTRARWREFLITAGPAIAVIATVLWVTSQFVSPAPPRKIVIAAAVNGSPYYRWAEQYQKFLAQSSITLEIRETSGSAENLRLINDPASDVQVAFLQGGIASTRDGPDLRSLGRLFYEPLWVFYHGDGALDRLTALKGKRILVGPAGSGTNQLAIRLLAANGVTGATATLVNMELPDYVETLEKGAADAGLLVLGPDARTIGRLFKTSNVRLMSLAEADAYAQRFPFLTRLDLKQGVIDFDRNVPAIDTALVTTTAALIVRDDLHSALANLMTQAIVEVHGKPVIDANGEAAIFSRAAEFPLAADPEFPLADEARRVYRSGPPLLQRYMPFWLATLLDRLIVLLVPIIGLSIPLMRFAPLLYTWRVRRGIVRWYGELKKVEAGARGPDQVAHALAEIDRIEATVSNIALPLGFTNQLYDLREHIDIVRRRLATRAPQTGGGAGGSER
ncbi:MAG TPA: TAXI family TRAP transporter solute-binding subunit [Xanthobacteraceae bacterium]